MFLSLVTFYFGLLSVIAFFQILGGYLIERWKNPHRDDQKIEVAG